MHFEFLQCLNVIKEQYVTEPKAFVSF